MMQVSRRLISRASMVPRMNAVAVSAVRNFATSKAPVPASHHQKTATLHDILKREIIAEKENAIEEDQDFLQVKKSILKKFKLEQEQGFGEVRMSTQYKGEEVKVSFDVQDEEELDPEFDEEAEEGEEGEEEGNERGIRDAEEGEDFDGEDDMEDVKTGINFTVTLTKPNVEGSVIVHCSTGEENYTVRRIRYVPNGVAEKHDDLYHGPDFNTLEDSLRESFEAYLKERHIDDDLNYFIASYSREKEQEEYINWLHKLEHYTKV